MNNEEKLVVLRRMTAKFTVTTKIDWRDRCTSIRNQGSCGSCTSFGVIGVIEALLKLKYSQVIDLSERDLFACSGGKCSEGNTVEATLDRAKYGIATEEQCPYAPIDIACFNYNRSVKIADYSYAFGPEGIKRALENGPVIGTMEVHESFFHYKSGVYHNLGPQDSIIGGHCITIVGYDDKLGAWLVRNSWGTGWGMQGYVWIKYNDSDIDTQGYILHINTPTPIPISKSKCKCLSFLRTLFRRFI